MLHLLSQRPSLTGSGITLDALVREAAGRWDQAAVVGVPAGSPRPSVGGLETEKVQPLTFGRPGLDFALPGMSDVMPYPSSRFSELTQMNLAQYRAAWSAHLAEVAESFRPDVVHSHHIWMMSSLARRAIPGVPMVVHCHATGLRQLSLCPELADEVLEGCALADRFVVLHPGHEIELSRALGVDRARIEVVGAGYREDLFHARGRREGPARRLLFVGKYSFAKGLPWLLEAFDRLASSRPELELHLAGSGEGAEAEVLRRRIEALGSRVVEHGRLDQPDLAELMRRCDVFVLPSLFEGLPLVLVEAFACGCRLVATALPGIESELAPRLGQALLRVAPPGLVGVDKPRPEDLPGFVGRLVEAMGRALDRREPVVTGPGDGAETSLPEPLRSFTWGAVFARIEAVWLAVSRL